jgi:hypothetical protein
LKRVEREVKLDRPHFRVAEGTDPNCCRFAYQILHTELYALVLLRLYYANKQMHVTGVSDKVKFAALYYATGGRVVLPASLYTDEFARKGVAVRVVDEHVRLTIGSDVYTLDRYKPLVLKREKVKHPVQQIIQELEGVQTDQSPSTPIRGHAQGVMGQGVTEPDQVQDVMQTPTTPGRTRAEDQGMTSPGMSPLPRPIVQAFANASYDDDDPDARDYAIRNTNPAMKYILHILYPHSPVIVNHVDTDESRIGTGINVAGWNQRVGLADCKYLAQLLRLYMSFDTYRRANQLRASFAVYVKEELYAAAMGKLNPAIPYATFMLY